MSVEVKTAEEVGALKTGAKFHANLGELEWKHAHAIMYHTAKKAISVKMLSGETVVGVLSEVPGYFGGFVRKVWVHVPGRKTRKGLPVAQILSWSGQKSPGLEDTLVAYLVLERPGTITDQHEDPEQALAWAKGVAEAM